MAEVINTISCKRHSWVPLETLHPVSFSTWTLGRVGEVVHTRQMGHLYGYDTGRSVLLARSGMLYTAANGATSCSI